MAHIGNAKNYNPKDRNHIWLSKNSPLAKMILNKGLDRNMKEILGIITKYKDITPETYEKFFSTNGINKKSLDKIQWLSKNAKELNEVIQFISHLPKNVTLFSDDSFLSRAVSEIHSKFNSAVNLYNLRPDQLGQKASELLLRASRSRFEAGKALLALRPNIQMTRLLGTGGSGNIVTGTGDDRTVYLRPNGIKYIKPDTINAQELLKDFQERNTKLPSKVQSLLNFAQALENQARTHINIQKIHNYIKNPSSTKVLSVFSSQYSTWREEVSETLEQLNEEIFHKKQEFSRLNKAYQKTIVASSYLEYSPSGLTDKQMTRLKQLRELQDNYKYHLDELSQSYEELIRVHTHTTKLIKERLNLFSGEMINTQKGFIQRLMTDALTPNRNIKIDFKTGMLTTSTTSIKDIPIYQLMEAIDDIGQKNFLRDIRGNAIKDTYGRYTLSGSGVTGTTRDLAQILAYEKTSEYRSSVLTYEMNRAGTDEDYVELGNYIRRKYRPPIDPRYRAGEEFMDEGRRKGTLVEKRTRGTIISEARQDGIDWMSITNPQARYEAMIDAYADEQWERQRIQRLPGPLRDPRKITKYDPKWTPHAPYWASMGYDPSNKAETLEQLLAMSQGDKLAKYAIFKKGQGWIRQKAGGPWRMFLHIFNQISNARSPDDIDRSLLKLTHYFIDSPASQKLNIEVADRPELVELIKMAHQRRAILSDPSTMNPQESRFFGKLKTFDEGTKVDFEAYEGDELTTNALKFFEYVRANRKLSKETYNRTEEEFWDQYTDKIGLNKKGGLSYPGDPRFAVSSGTNYSDMLNQVLVKRRDALVGRQLTNRKDVYDDEGTFTGPGGIIIPEGINENENFEMNPHAGGSLGVQPILISHEENRWKYMKNNNLIPQEHLAEIEGFSTKFSIEQKLKIRNR